MAIAITLQQFLQNHALDYEIIDHRRTSSTLHSAEAAHIPGDRMAKSVLLGDDESYMLAVICETGAVPPVGDPYGIETLVDVALLQQPDLYFESGDHGKLLHLSTDSFRELEENAIMGEFSYHI
ncbi:MAG: YbaK/EbsC family protein [Candidatus Thiodiazotropha sp. (ex. Lucinisca nassula)]|nr:YbaK/EbsC family protein [Candidatus Thiodiazotropha sp. (ex. Lucinisca nassula)]